MGECAKGYLESLAYVMFTHTYVFVRARLHTNQVNLLLVLHDIYLLVLNLNVCRIEEVLSVGVLFHVNGVSTFCVCRLKIKFNSEK